MQIIRSIQNRIYEIRGKRVMLHFDLADLYEVETRIFKSGSETKHKTFSKRRIGEHDAQLNQIYDAMENLLDEKASQRKWNERERIGYK